MENLSFRRRRIISLALNEEDAREMFAAAKENGMLLMEAYAYLHTPYIASLKADVQSGLLNINPQNSDQTQMMA